MSPAASASYRAAGELPDMEEVCFHCDGVNGQHDPDCPIVRLCRVCGEPWCECAPTPDTAALDALLRERDAADLAVERPRCAWCCAPIAWGTCHPCALPQGAANDPLEADLNDERHGRDR